MDVLSSRITRFNMNGEILSERSIGGRQRRTCLVPDVLIKTKLCFHSRDKSLLVLVEVPRFSNPLKPRHRV